MLTIDGTMGEGGGQILRSSLALSARTGTAFRIERIRGKRQRPGLQRQHLTAVRAMAEVCSARVGGAELGSTTLEFVPGAVRHGNYHFAVGTAGSATLVLQTLLPALLTAAGSSQLVIDGGTHNPHAPPYEFLAHSYLPLLHRMGATVTVALKRAGFYPAGGGRLEVHVQGGSPLIPLQLLARGDVHRVQIRALVSQLPERIAAREVRVLASALADCPLDADFATLESAGPGNVALVSVRCAALTETFTGFGEIGLRAETVAHRLAAEVRRYLAASVPVAEHLADQLLLPCALAGAGEFRTCPPSLHTRTNADVIGLFLPVRVQLVDEGPQGCVVRVNR